MTEVWHESVLRAGIMLTPGPLAAATVAITSGRFLGRFGAKLFATIGIVLFGLASLWWRLRVGETPAYASEMLPGLLLGGIGVGFVLPSLASGATAALPRERFATGSAVFTMTRQLGFVLGVSILVAVLGTPGSGDPVAAFDRGWVFIIIASGLGVVSALFIERKRSAVEAPAAQSASARSRAAATAA